MREVVTLQLGQCGNQIGVGFWETISKEHGINYKGQLKDTMENEPEDHKNAKPEVFFNFIESYARYVPRSILVDTEPGVINAIQSSDIGQLFSPDNFVVGQSGTGNNWAKGYYSDGAQLLDSILDSFHHEIELCDSVDAIQVFHSLGGGTGSGLGSLLIEKLKEEYPHGITATYSIIPSPKVSNVVVETYNTILSLNQLIDHASECFIFDNEALHAISSSHAFHDIQPSYHDLNHLIALAMSGITCSLRFPGQLNCDYRKLAVNLIPMPRLHFFSMSYAPLLPMERLAYQTMNCHEMISQLFQIHNIMCAMNPRNGKYLACALLFRGQQLSVEEIEKELSKLTSISSPHFVDWIPNNVLVSLSTVSPMLVPRIDKSKPHEDSRRHYHVPPSPTYQNATMVANSTAINEIWKRFLEQYSSMFQRKAYLHWYLNEGMEEQEFVESEGNLQDLIAEYLTYEQQQDAFNMEEEEEKKETLKTTPPLHKSKEETKPHVRPNYPEEIYP